MTQISTLYLMCMANKMKSGDIALPALNSLSNRHKCRSVPSQKSALVVSDSNINFATFLVTSRVVLVHHGKFYPRTHHAFFSFWLDNNRAINKSFCFDESDVISSSMCAISFPSGCSRRTSSLSCWANSSTFGAS